MRRTGSPLVLLYALALATTGCDIRSGSSLNPLVPELGPIAPTPMPAATSYMGTWQSAPAATPGLDPKTCTNFEWTVSSQTSNSVSGQFSAMCGGTIPVSGSATGQLTSSTTVVISISGSATVPGIGPCAVFITANGTIQGDTLPLQYSGTTCLGAFSGNETLHRSDIFSGAGGGGRRRRSRRPVRCAKSLRSAGKGYSNGSEWADNGFVDPALYIPAIEP